MELKNGLVINFASNGNVVVSPLKKDKQDLKQAACESKIDYTYEQNELTSALKGQILAKVNLPNSSLDDNDIVSHKRESMLDKIGKSCAKLDSEPLTKNYVRHRNKANRLLFSVQSKLNNAVTYGNFRPVKDLNGNIVADFVKAEDLPDFDPELDKTLSFVMNEYNPKTGELSAQTRVYWCDNPGLTFDIGEEPYIERTGFSKNPNERTYLQATYQKITDDRGHTRAVPGLEVFADGYSISKDKENDSTIYHADKYLSRIMYPDYESYRENFDTNEDLFFSSLSGIPMTEEGGNSEENFDKALDYPYMQRMVTFPNGACVQQNMGYINTEGTRPKADEAENKEEPKDADAILKEELNEIENSPLVAQYKDFKKKSFNLSLDVARKLYAAIRYGNFNDVKNSEGKTIARFEKGGDESVVLESGKCARPSFIMREFNPETGVQEAVSYIFNYDKTNTNWNQNNDEGPVVERFTTGGRKDYMRLEFTYNNLPKENKWILNPKVKLYAENFEPLDSFGGKFKADKLIASQAFYDSYREGHIGSAPFYEYDGARMFSTDMPEMVKDGTNPEKYDKAVEYPKQEFVQLRSHFGASELPFKTYTRPYINTKGNKD